MDNDNTKMNYIKRNWLHVFAMGLGFAIGNTLIAAIDRQAEFTLGGLATGITVSLSGLIGWYVSVYAVKKIRDSNLLQKYKKIVLSFLPLIYFGAYLFLYLIIDNYSTIHWENILILLAFLAIVTTIVIKYKIWRYFNTFTRNQRACIIAAICWFFYVVIRTSDSYEFLGHDLDKWREDSFFINLLLPPLLITGSIFVYRWIKKGK